MTYRDYTELCSVEHARYNVLMYMRATRTYDSGDWKRCLHKWDDELDWLWVCP